MNQLSFAAGILLTFCYAGFAQTREFELASVHASERRADFWEFRTSNPTSFTASNITLRELFRQAYRLKEYQISGGPKWLDSATYAIAAKPPQPATPEEHRLMVRSLLAERFQLKFHIETRELDVMVLSISKNGPKFQEAVAASPPNGYVKSDSGVFGQSALFKNIKMEIFVNMLSGNCGTLNFLPVIDGTGLTGSYDLRTSTIANPNGLPRTLTDQLCEAISQLGLEFKRQKMPIQIYVIDSAEQTPTEN